MNMFIPIQYALAMIIQECTAIHIECMQHSPWRWCTWTEQHWRHVSSCGKWLDDNSSSLSAPTDVVPSQFIQSHIQSSIEYIIQSWPTVQILHMLILLPFRWFWMLRLSHCPWTSWLMPSLSGHHWEGSHQTQTCADQRTRIQGLSVAGGIYDWLECGLRFYSVSTYMYIHMVSSITGHFILWALFPDPLPLCIYSCMHDLWTPRLCIYIVGEAQGMRLYYFSSIIVIRSQLLLTMILSTSSIGEEAWNDSTSRATFCRAFAFRSFS